MNHLTMEQLLQLRGAASDIGSGDARVHLQACEECQAELERLHQRVARLKALPSLHPPRNVWPVISQRLEVQRHRKRNRWMGVAGIAMAASVLLAVVVTEFSHPVDLAAATAAIDTAKAQSRALENTLMLYNPESRVTDGRTARIAADLEDRIADLDRQLQMTQLEESSLPDQQVLRLWRERVGLLDALVDVHITKASNVGL